MNETLSAVCVAVDTALGGVLLANALEPRLAPAAGIVCADRNAGHRRGRLLRPVGFQRRTFARPEGDYGAGRAAFSARAPPGREAEQGKERRAAFPSPRRLLL